MTVLDGKKTAQEIRLEIRQRISEIERRYCRRVGLAVVMVGDDPASAVYVRNKIRACEEVGIRSTTLRLPYAATEREVEEQLFRLAEDENVQGILLQLPLPPHLNENRLIECISPEKDVDGFAPQNMGKLARGDLSVRIPCTPRGIMELLTRYQIGLSGKRAVIIGRSAIVGRPLATLFLNNDATVTICHTKTNALKEECLRADILVSAVGKAGIVTADMVKEGAVVIDVGMNRTPNGKLCGDVDYERVKEKASYITPVPGGVGPMTVAMLLANVCDAAEQAFLQLKK